MSKDSYRILVKTAVGVKLLLRVKELPDRSVLYSLPPLDGRRQAVLHSEFASAVPAEGSQTFPWSGSPIQKVVDHLTYHQEGPHVITSPGSEEHWGRIVQPPLQDGIDFQQLGLLLPAALERFPDHSRPLNPLRDTQIDLSSMGIHWFHLRIGLIGSRITREGGTFSMPESLMNLAAGSSDGLLGGTSWFLLPLASCTVLFVIHREDGEPPRTALVRHESAVGGKVHVSYFE